MEHLTLAPRHHKFFITRTMVQFSPLLQSKAGRDRWRIKDLEFVGVVLAKGIGDHDLVLGIFVSATEGQKYKTELS
ncbi:MAG: hypothetical protein Q9224_005683 [Gallowayella concinna]